MRGLFHRQAFTGFGPCGLRQEALPDWFQVRASRPGRLRALVREHCPRQPGVYGMVDAAGELVYVGKAKCLRSRLLSYFRPKSRDPKAGRILEATRTLAWEPGPDELAALLRELELIRRWRPRFNVHGQPRRHRRTYVCAGRRPAPYLFLASRPPKTAVAVFGPVPAGRRALEAVRRLNDWYRLRDCPQAQEMIFAEEQELFPVLRAAGCLRHEIASCLGPCAGACTRRDYADTFRSALAFLEGKDTSSLEVLERDMTAASTAMQYERAAVLRDRLEQLQWLGERLEHLRGCARRSLVYPLVGHDGQERWYLVHRGRVQAVAPPGGPEAADAIRQVFSPAGKLPGPLGLAEIDGALLVAGWFRRHAAERQRTLSPEEALARCTATL